MQYGFKKFGIVVSCCCRGGFCIQVRSKIAPRTLCYSVVDAIAAGQ